MQMIFFFALSLILTHTVVVVQNMIQRYDYSGLIDYLRAIGRRLGRIWTRISRFVRRLAPRSLYVRESDEKEKQKELEKKMRKKGRETDRSEDPYASMDPTARSFQHLSSAHGSRTARQSSAPGTARGSTDDNITIGNLSHFDVESHSDLSSIASTVAGAGAAIGEGRDRSARHDKRYVYRLKGVYLRLEKHHLTCIVGPKGAGKVCFPSLTLSLAVGTHKSVLCRR